eukprot:GHVS01103236.1.p2 GENE.GHVS01103236.1~~GHVS01103236.1.p2  ORF type:complete len:113 (-),score=11.74 GHVS01103236.1:237-575(-)
MQQTQKKTQITCQQQLHNTCQQQLHIYSCAMYMYNVHVKAVHIMIDKTDMQSFEIRCVGLFYTRKFVGSQSKRTHPTHLCNRQSHCRAPSLWVGLDVKRCHSARLPRGVSVG